MKTDDHEPPTSGLGDAPDPAGPGRRISGRRQKFGGAIPVRFEQETIERIKQIADREGTTVSSWIRREISARLQEVDEVGSGLAPVIYIRESRDPSSAKSIPGSRRLVACV